MWAAARKLAGLIEHEGAFAMYVSPYSSSPFGSVGTVMRLGVHVLLWNTLSLLAMWAFYLCLDVVSLRLVV